LTQARADAKAKLAEAQQAFKRERDSALDEVAALKGTVEESSQARADAEARAVELSQRLRKVRQTKAQDIARSIGAVLSPFVIAAAVATLGFWTYQLIWSAPQPLLAVTSDSTPEAEQQRLAAIEEAQRQAKAAGDAEAKPKAAEAEQQRLKDDVQRQTQAATDADAKRRAAPAATNKLFEIRRDMEARAPRPDTSYFSAVVVRSIDECEQQCTQSADCNAFALDKRSPRYGAAGHQCWLYSDAKLVPNSNFDSGVRK
jgi:PAN domain-containing protein